MSLGVIRDAINAKPFQLVDVSSAANDITPYKAAQVGSLGLFQPEPLFTDSVQLWERAGTLSLVPISPRGGPSTEIQVPLDKIRTVSTVRLSEEAQINASELFRAGSFHTLAGQRNLEFLRNQKLTIMADAMDLTFEHLWLNALKGDVLNALVGGTTASIVNLFTLFGVSQEAEVAFDLTNSTAGTLTRKLAAIRRTMLNNLEADAVRVDHIHVLVSPEFMDDLMANVDVIAWAKVNNPNAELLRTSKVFGIFDWMGFRFEEYRLGNTGGTVGGSWIAADKCIIFPVGPPIYTTFFSPGEFFAEILGPGLPRYARAAADPTWDEWIKLKLQSYPLPICWRPKALMKGKRGS